MTMTEEQHQILATAPDTFTIMSITAFAGTDPASTLAEYARTYPEASFLYLTASNRAANTARRSFPENVTCSTIHTYAYEQQRDQLQGSEITINLDVNDINRLITCEAPVVPSDIIRTLRRFCQSSDPCLLDSHIDSYHETYLCSDAAEEQTIADRRALLIRQTQEFWDAVSNGKLKKLTDEMQLKRFSLIGSYEIEQDIIMFDEAHDYNPVIVGLIKQSGKPVMLVGDPYQKIYSFQGSVDAMGAVKADHAFSLTHSFRFGPEIAEHTNRMLQLLGEQRRVTGMAAERTGEGTTCLITRTNAELFSRILTLGDIPFRIEGAITVRDLMQLRDTYWIWLGLLSKVHNRTYRTFTSFEALEEFGYRTENPEIIRSCRFVKDHTEGIPRIIAMMQRISADHSDSRASIILSTCHKGKGLEYDKVVIADDFRYPYQKIEGRWEERSVPIEELHLLYVAITRARREVVIPASLQEVLTYVQSIEPLVFPEAEPAHKVVQARKKVVVTQHTKKKAVPRKRQAAFSTGGPDETESADRLKHTSKRYRDSMKDMGFFEDDQSDGLIHIEIDNERPAEENWGLDDWEYSLDDQDAEFWESEFDFEVPEF
ncbi:MAG: ATP-binding domain-containing protein [Spirochaetia bacterium]|nr:ATP-binding domain-containing protein [Spirochaetia bacterium]